MMIKRFYWLVTLMVLAVATSAAQANSTAWSPAMAGVGAHGYDWQIGTWSCTNSMPSAMGGPASQMLTVTRTNGGAVMFHTTGENLDVVAYNVYVAKTKTWLGPYALADGSYGTESTTQTGKTTVWAGPEFFAAMGKTTQARDTYVVLSATKYTDLGEYQSGDGTWKTQYNTTCTKT
jgi:hypothetical protein